MKILVKTGKYLINILFLKHVTKRVQHSIPTYKRDRVDF